MTKAEVKSFVDKYILFAPVAEVAKIPEVGNFEHDDATVTTKFTLADGQNIWSVVIVGSSTDVTRAA